MHQFTTYLLYQSALLSSVLFKHRKPQTEPTERVHINVTMYHYGIRPRKKRPCSGLRYT